MNIIWGEVQEVMGNIRTKVNCPFGSILHAFCDILICIVSPEFKIFRDEHGEVIRALG